MSSVSIAETWSRSRLIYFFRLSSCSGVLESSKPTEYSQWKFTLPGYIQEGE